MSSLYVEGAHRVHVLVVEDEVKTRESLAEGLSMEFGTVSTAATGSEALAKLESESYDLVVLDWMLPDLEGTEIVREVRRNGMDVPVLMLTARTAAADRVVGLESGADDYLFKPFAFAELLARCRALLRPSPSMAAWLLSCGDLQLDTRTRSVKRADREIQLAPLEVDLLEYLMRSEGQIVTSEMLERDVWKRSTVTGSLDNVIEVQVAQLRRKIGGEGVDGLICIVRGIGYRLGTGCS